MANQENGEEGGVIFSLPFYKHLVFVPIVKQTNQDPKQNNSHTQKQIHAKKSGNKHKERFEYSLNTEHHCYSIFCSLLLLSH